MDIRQTNTLNVQQARDNADDKHICPLQLDLIERCILLWSNPGDVILSPFMGIGSEGYVALKQKRRFVGVELKRSYYDVAVKNLLNAEANAASLFDDMAAA
jgi:DNA modification methylase